MAIGNSNRLSIEIVVDDKGSVTVRKVGKEIEDLGKSVKKTDSSMSGLRSTLTDVAKIWGTLKVAQYVKDTALLAARYETLGVTMNVTGRNAGYSTEQMRGFADQLQRTGISMIESRQQLTSMAAAQLDLSKAHELARAAQNLAVVGNINSSEAYARMVQGIKSGEVEVLRTLGLNLTFEQSYKALAKQLGVNSTKLTEQEKLQARMNIVLQAATGYSGTYESAMATAGKKLSSLTRYIEDFRVVSGEAFGPATGAFVDGLTESIRGMTETLKEPGAQETLRLLGNLAGKSVSVTFRIADQLYGAFETAGMVDEGRIGLGDWMTMSPERAKWLRSNRGTEADIQEHIARMEKQSKSWFPWDAQSTAAKEKLVELQAQLAGLQSSKGVGLDPWMEGAGRSLSSDQSRALAAAKPPVNRTSEEDAKKAAKALAEVNKEIAELTLSPKEFQQYSLSLEIAELAKDLGAANPQLQRYAELKRLAIEADVMGDPLYKDAYDKAQKGSEASRLLREVDSQEVLQAQSSAFAESQQKNLEVLTEFDKAFRQAVQGETAFKIASIEEQARVWLEAGADEVRVAKWVEAEKLKVSREWSDGVIRAFQDYALAAGDAAAQAERLFTNAFRGAEDALVQFVMTGKLSFSDLANSIVADLARIAIQRTITGPLASGMGGIFASLFHQGTDSVGSGGPGRMVDPSLFAFAPRFHNGLAPDESPAILQEGEEVVPRGGRKSQTQLNLAVHVHNNAQAQVTTQQSRGSNGEPRLDLFIDQLGAESVRSGGKMAKALEQTYGLRRVGY